MYSIHNQGKPVVVERLIRTLKTKIYKYMTLVSKNVYIDKLDYIVGEYNNAYHRTIKMKLVDVKDNTYIDFKKEVNDKDPTFKVNKSVYIAKSRQRYHKPLNNILLHVSNHTLKDMYMFNYGTKR